MRQDGGLFDVEVDPQYAKNGWIYLSYSEPLEGYKLPPRRSECAERTRAQAGGGRGNQPPSIPSMTVIVRGKIKDNAWVDQQVLFRGPQELVHHRELPLRFALHLRPAGAPVLLDRRQGHAEARAGSVEADRQDPSHQRRRIGAEGQPVREPRRRGADRSGATVIATRRGSRSIPSPASCGKPSTVRPAATS